MRAGRTDPRLPTASLLNSCRMTRTICLDQIQMRDIRELSDFRGGKVREAIENDI